MRILNLYGESETTYVYNTNAKLSSMLMKTTDGRVTKYVYGRGLIGEETSGVFKTYHFDYRGSTVAITDINGNVTDTFEYDTYGKLTSRTGSSDIIFLYNGRDGVVTDGNGLIYMRARYYAPELRRFINADILAGDIANGITLNRYAYANGNPVSFVDPKGLSANRCRAGTYAEYRKNLINGTALGANAGNSNENRAIHLIAWSYGKKDVREYENYLVQSGHSITADGNTDDWDDEIWKDLTSRSSFARAAYTKKKELIEKGVPKECIDVQRIDGADDLSATWEMWSEYESVASLDFYSHGHAEGAEVYKGSGDFWLSASELNFTSDESDNTAYAAFYGCNTANGEFAQNFANKQDVTVYAQDDYASFSHNMTWRQPITTHDTSGDVYLVAFDSWFGLKNDDGMGKVFYPEQ